jgi:hypothetical protein
MVAMSINELINTSELRRIALARPFQFYWDGYGYSPCKPTEEDLKGLKVILNAREELKFIDGNTFYLFSEN